jgi:DNA-binding GntR family transcriptional regulator
MASEFVRPRTLVEVVSDHVRGMIFRGEYEPGAPLREAELCAALDVSRTTAREALWLLSEDGLVQLTPHRGARVIELVPQLVREVYSIRTLLEPYAVRVALEEAGYGEEHLEKLQSLLRRMAEADRAKDSFELTKADIEFHTAMCEPSNHVLLLDILRMLQARTRLCITFLAFRGLDLGPQEVQHRQILDAIRAGDAGVAERVVAEHLGDSRSRLLAGIAADVSTTP